MLPTTSQSLDSLFERVWTLGLVSLGYIYIYTRPFKVRTSMVSRPRLSSLDGSCCEGDRGSSWGNCCVELASHIMSSMPIASSHHYHLRLN